jgi:electron transport complex protein RnfC
VQYYRAAKGEIRDLEQKQLKAEQSKQRFELRQERLRRAEEQKEAERQARAAKAAQAKAAQAKAAPAAAGSDAAAAKPAGLSDELKKLKIEASMAQVALKKAEKQLATHASPELQAQVDELRSAAAIAQQALDTAMAANPPAAAPAPAPAADDGALKKAKIDAAMLRAQLRKLEKLEAPSEEQQGELQQLRSQLEAAEKLLASLQEQAPEPAAKPAADDGALKKAKIDAAMLRAQLRKLEKLEAPNDEQQSELQQLRSQLEAAEKLLTSLQDQAPAAPAKAPAAEAPDALKKAKIELAMKRAELKKAEKAGSDEAVLDTLRSALAQAEQALHQAEDASGKPAPALVRTDKQPIDETSRALKTEVAFARADLRKLERDDSSAAEALEQARSRLSEAERQLMQHQTP